ncbi:MAG: GLUG motif-containing protein, partial [Candidatus Hydrogenedentota bacterium]
MTKNFSHLGIVGIIVVAFAGAGLAWDAGAQTMISSIEELQKIGDPDEEDYPLDGFYWLAEDIDASETADWNEGAGFDPIGDSEDGFSGIFDGNGHTITGLVIDRPEEDEVGLLGRVRFANIEDVGLEDCSVTGGDNTGALVGNLDSGLIVDSYASGSVTGEYCVGGLVGKKTGGEVSRSYATGDVIGLENQVG